MRDKAPKIAMLLRRLLSGVQDVKKAIVANTESTHASEERNRANEASGHVRHRIVSFDDKTVSDSRKENDRQYSTQKSIKWATWFAVGAAIIYASIAAWQACEMRKATIATEQAAKAAECAAKTAQQTLGEVKKQSKLSAEQLELAQRPWVDMRIDIDGPLTFDVNGARIPLKITLRNTGHSPAMSTRISPRALIGSKSLSAINYRDEVCQEAARTATAYPRSGDTLFPNIDFGRHYDVILTQKDIDNGKASKENPKANFGEVMISPSVIVCVAYRPSFNDTSMYDVRLQHL